MTKKKITVPYPDDPKLGTLYVALVRVHYRSMEPEHSRYIDPYLKEDGSPDFWNPAAERFTLDHLSPAERELVLMRKVVAEDK